MPCIFNWSLNINCCRWWQFVNGVVKFVVEMARMKVVLIVVQFMTDCLPCQVGVRIFYLLCDLLNKLINYLLLNQWIVAVHVSNLRKAIICLTHTNSECLILLPTCWVMRIYATIKYVVSLDHVHDKHWNNWKLSVKNIHFVLFRQDMSLFFDVPNSNYQLSWN